MPCYTPYTSITEEQNINHLLNKAHYFLNGEQIMQIGGLSPKEMLCKACKFLTEEQMRSIDGLDIYQGLYAWYMTHLHRDIVENIKNNIELTEYLKEANRVGFNIIFENGFTSIGRK